MLTFDSSTLAADVPSAAALTALHRALHESCRRSYRWSSTPHGDAADHLKVCLLRRVITLLRRAGHALVASDDTTKHMTRSQHTATLAAVVSSAIRPSALRDVEEFKMLMWDSLSVVFNNDQALADVVISLAKDNVALEDLVHDSLIDLNSIGGNTPPGAYDFDLMDEGVPTTASSSSSSRHSRQRVAFVPQVISPDSSLNSSAIHHATTGHHHHHQNAINERSSSQLSSGGSKLHRSGIMNTTMVNSSNRGKISPTHSHLNQSDSLFSSSSLAKLWSRQTLLLVLFVIIAISLITSFQAWRELKRGEAAGTFSPRGAKKHYRGGGHTSNEHEASIAGESQSPRPYQRLHRRDAMSDDASLDIERPAQRPLPAITTTTTANARPSRSSRQKRNSEVLDTLRQREQELLASMHAEQAAAQRQMTLEAEEPPRALPIVIPPIDIASQLSAPKAQPTRTSPCGSDSTKNPSGLPGRSYDPVDSITALSFDLTDDELATIAKLEASKTATRHTFIRDIVARAMDADPRSDASSYHSFFSDRSAKMEMVDVHDQLAAIPATDDAAAPSSSSASDEMVLLRRRNAGAACPAVQPALVDAVYTYVNPNSASHQSAVRESCRARGRECSDHRFRDFNELMYSLRTVHHRGGMSGGGPAGEQSAGRFVGNVFVVVADRDQIPGWLHHEHVGNLHNVAAPPQSPPRPPSDGRIMRHDVTRRKTASATDGSKNSTSSASPRTSGRVFSVTHKEIFPPEVHDAALPNFNSFAIETNLHRIPGVGRFFVYFNNDMLWGRKVSYFDYFRPISHARQQYRIETTVEGQCLAEHFRSDSVTSIGAEEPSKTLSAPLARRAVVFMEPIHYFDRSDELADRRMTPKYSPLPPSYDIYARRHYGRGVTRNRRGQIIVQAQIAPIVEPPPQTQTKFEASLVSNNANNASCAFNPVKTDSIFRLTMKTPHSGDTQHKTTNYNRKLVFTNYGLPPSHSFAHYPGIYDRWVLSRMLEDEVKDEAATTRAARFRTQDSIWTTMVYPYVAFAHRRAVDRKLVGQRLKLWTRETKYETLSNDVSRLGPLMDPNFGLLPEAYQGDMWLSQAAANAAKLRPLSIGGHNAVVREKLRDWLVTMEGKNEALYHFCMMTSGGMVSMYHGELQQKMKLFVTVNDDLSIVNPYSADAVTSLLQLISGGSPSAPWERHR
ncbi:transmembrane protein, putative [Bodo saltans]|uniref:Transmembrane protein, putative n=1 Tax=Bodo saltans TaxID=75058 RepID=A0A0S4IZI1_BODSA|nr:transmembrane protein, putative [Bodo saltans]|eukprot:CUG67001.1 transmembrane protein, putative [Bodo saltans]